jgi:hypothetical protein
MNNQEQIKAWSRLYGRQITEEEYREISDNLRGYFETLHSWNEEEKHKIND